MADGGVVVLEDVVAALSGGACGWPAVTRAEDVHEGLPGLGHVERHVEVQVEVAGCGGCLPGDDKGLDLVCGAEAVKGVVLVHVLDVLGARGHDLGKGGVGDLAVEVLEYCHHRGRVGMVHSAEPTGLA